MIQEFGLENFPKLTFLKLQMNRGCWFSEILDYLQSPNCTLRSIDLGYNDLIPSLMLNLVQVLPNACTLQKLDLQDNILGL